jgi:hypothetical protein
MHASPSAALFSATTKYDIEHWIHTISGLSLGGLSTGILRKSQTNTVYTVTLICRSLISLALEYMAKMTPAVGANDLRPLHAKCAIHVPGHSTGNRVKVCRPATAGFELVVSSIERRIATCAVVNAF